MLFDILVFNFILLFVLYITIKLEFGEDYSNNALYDSIVKLYLAAVNILFLIVGSVIVVIKVFLLGINKLITFIANGFKLNKGGK